MLPARITQTLLRSLDRVISKRSAKDTQAPAHQRTGQRGEEDAYFYLRRRGYVMVARNFRTDKDVLCFIEVKTRTAHDVKPAEAAVDRKKRQDIRGVLRDYLHLRPERTFRDPPQWRFDVVTVYYEGHPLLPTFELFQNALLSS
jgi:putative endonuclease